MRWIPWRFSHLGGPLNTLIGVHLRRPVLRREIARGTTGLPDDITVLIAHRNRADYRVRNALRGIRAQNYPFGRVQVMVIDYGSAPEQLERLRACCEEHAAECVAVGCPGEWSKAHCLNIGIRRTGTKFLMVSDVDVILADNYLREAVAVLQADPLTAVLSPCVRLPESCTEELQRASGRPEWLQPDRLRPLGRIKTRGAYSPGMVASYTYLFRRIRGYDEFYRTYGVEDEDLAERFARLGLRLVSIGERTFYLHQWHPRHEGVDPESLAEARNRNADYFRRVQSIRRNPSGWGEPV